MFAILVMVACGDGGTGSGVIQASSMVVRPSSTALTTRIGDSATSDFRAYAIDTSGAEVRLEVVAWSTSNLSAGTIDEDGHFVTAENNGGYTTITASYLGQEATAELTVGYVEDVFEDGLDEGIADAFDAVEPDLDEDFEILYPPDGVRVPQNLNGLAFYWDEPPGDHVTRLRLETPISSISVFTDSDSWASTSETLQRASATNRGGEVWVTVTSGRWEDGSLSDVVTGPGVSLQVNRLDAVGSIFLWNATSASIERLPFGAVEAERFWPPEGSERTGAKWCVGCHVLNEASQTMVVTHNGIDDVFSLVDIGDLLDPVLMSESSGQNTLTFKDVSPDGEYLLGTGRGTVRTWPLSPGSAMTEHDLPGRYSQPAFDPDGSQVALVRAMKDMNNDMSFEGGEIQLFPWQDGVLGTPEVLVPRSETYNQYYPVFSPEGAWIAYNRSTGDSYADPDAELMLVSAAGGEPIVMDLANDGADNQCSYPRWAPLSDDDVMWLAFSSRLPYPGRDGFTSNVWVTAIDPAKAAAGEDPSSLAFWLPGQDPETDNHLAQWWIE